MSLGSDPWIRISNNPGELGPDYLLGSISSGSQEFILETSTYANITKLLSLSHNNSVSSEFILIIIISHNR